jgi:hypothetical protein
MGGGATAPDIAPETCVDPPTTNEAAAPVASKDGGRSVNRTTYPQNYTPISLLDKWRFQPTIFADRHLSSTAKVVAGVLLDCLNCRTGKCCPSLECLARRVGKKRRVISAALTQLRQRDWLITRTRRGASDYQLNFDGIQRDGAQKSAHDRSRGVKKTAHLGAQNPAHEEARETAHLNTGKEESRNGSQERLHPTKTPQVGATKGKREVEKARRTRLAEDWQPSERNFGFAIQCGLSAEDIPREVLKFKNHHIGKGTVMLDWDRAWQNWCLRAVEYAACRPKGTRSHRSLVAGLFPTDSPASQSGRS